MAELKNAGDVLALAMELESLGRTFYESLALACDDAQVAKLSARLAKAEAKHFELFRKMRESLPAAIRTMPLDDKPAAQARELLKKLVVPRPEEVRRVALGGNLKNALNMAIRMEEDSVRFYEGVLLGAQANHAPAIRRIVQEEKGHLLALLAARGG